MLKFILAICAFSAFALSSNAHGGTVYRTKTLPLSGSVCMIELKANKIINGNLVQDVELGTFDRFQQAGAFLPTLVNMPYKALRITLVNGQYYEFTDGNLEQQQVSFMAKLSTCKK